MSEVESPSHEAEKHLEDDRDWIYPRKFRVFVMRLAAICIFLFPPEGYSRGFDEFKFIANLENLDLPILFFELLALQLLAIFAYKNTCALKTELKTFGLFYLSAFVIFFPPTMYRLEFAGYAFIGNVRYTHWVIWILEIIAVAITFILVQKQKEK